MAVNDWPASLPQSFMLEGFEVAPPQGAVSSGVDAGQPFQRQRYTAAVQPFTGNLLMSRTQYDTLMTFWKTTLGMGALAFNWRDPVTLDDAELQFMADQPPRITAKSADKFIVNVQMRVLP